ncbi:MAG: Ig-like domain-containing protein [Myxococcota bacterium]
MWTRRLALLALLAPLPALSEGTTQLSTNSRMVASTILGVDIVDFTTERILWTGQGQLRVSDPTGTFVGNFNSGATITPTQNGAWQVQTVQDQNGAWDIAVQNPVRAGGRLFSRNWAFNTGTYAGGANALNTSFFALVGNGAANADAVLEVRFAGLQGFIFNVETNQTGVNGRNAGRSVPTNGNSVSPQFRMYLAPPTIARYTGGVRPTITNFRYGSTGTPLSCNLLAVGQNTGTFSFTTNVTGTYHLECDLNRDGVFNIADPADLTIIGTASPGTNSVVWTGTDRNGNAVPFGTYNCRVAVRVGELHFVAADIETSYQGMRMFEVDQSANRSALRMYWDDALVQANEVVMPNGQRGLVSSGATGMDSGLSSAAPVANVNARAWGNYVDVSKGNDAYLDTFTWARSSTSAPLAVQAIDPTLDTDGEGLSDHDERCIYGTNPNRRDTDNDGLDDRRELFVTLTDPLNPDTDGDGANDGAEVTLGINPLDPDTDGDFINDGVESNGGQAIDSDGDGTLDARDLDSDNDGITDTLEGTTDLDSDGLGNWRDPDDDGDGITTAQEIADGAIWGNNVDADLRQNWYDTDSDGDGLSDAAEGRQDRDNDGIPDYLDPTLDIPVARADAASVNEDATVTVAVLSNDSGLGNTPIALSIVTPPAHGTVIINVNNTITYIPAPDYFGPDSFVYRVRDADGQSAQATVTLTVRPVNDVPSAAPDNASLDEDTSVTTPVLANDSGLGDRPITVTIVTPPQHGRAVVNPDGTVTYTPAPNYNGPDSYTYRARDVDGQTSDGVVSITVRSVNDTPIGVVDSATVAEDSTTDLAVLANDLGVGDAPLVVSITVPPQHGTASVNPDGTIRYTPDANYNGEDTLTYLVHDADGETSTAVVHIHVRAVNDAPIAVPDLADSDPGVAFEVPVLANDSDPDGDPLILVGATTPAHGTASLGPGGTVTYTAAAGFVGTDTFRYTISDGHGGTATATVTVTVGADDDGDGLTNARERQIGTDPHNPDTDGDHLSDGVEVNGGLTNPLDDDSDEDGVLDGNEDTNHNGVVDAGETDPRAADSDGDGVQDGTEIGLSAPQGVGTSSASFVPDRDPSTTTAPTVADTDGDGLSDGAEDRNHDGRVDVAETDPNDQDSDDDGVTDSQERQPFVDSDGDGLINARDADSDNDGIFDGTEQGVTMASAGTDTTRGAFIPDADTSSTTDPLNADTDGGGASDGAEDPNHNGKIDPGERDPNDPRDDVNPPGDSDGDGLSDQEEVAIGTDPHDADSDDDGVRDGAEPNPTEDSDGDGLINALDPDSDNDGLFDGTELGLTTPDTDTRTVRGFFVADADPTTHTNPLLADSDQGGVDDGAEDANHNGAIDVGETDPLDPRDDRPPLDSDNDGLTDAEERSAGTDPMDADSDDDGVIDGEEPNWRVDTDGDGRIDALDPDSDGDGILDGTELAKTAPASGTDVSRGNFVADADPTTHTNPLLADTDRGSVPDGVEDTNKDGKVDVGERDPLDPRDDVADADGDGIPDDVEGTGDADNDGIPNFQDPDSDGDTISDAVEAGDHDPRTPPVDTDNDGTPDYLDTDADGDGVLDANEAGDADLVTPPIDTDHDGAPDYVDTDSDNDGVPDRTDNCRLITNADQADANSNGIGDACELDADGDTIPDSVEGTGDADADGTPNYLDLDSDGDGILDATEAGDANPMTPPVDTDGDGTPDFLDTDADGDAVPDKTEAGDVDLNTPPVDTDTDGKPDYVDTDSDGDGVLDGGDNCRLVPNADQKDTDGNGVGDACQNDGDGDGVPDATDNCPLIRNADQKDTNMNGVGDACEPAGMDSDGDGVPDATDNCPLVKNADQKDADGDKIGDACDKDADNDGLEDGFSVAGGGCSCSAGREGTGSAGWAAGLFALFALLRRRSFRRSAALLTLGLGLFLGSSASAQQLVSEPRSYSAERFELAIDGAGLFDVNWAGVPKHLSYGLYAWFGGAHDPLAIYQRTDNSQTGALLGGRLGAAIGGSIALFDWVQLGAELPIIVYQMRDQTVTGVSGPLADINKPGVGDLKLVPKIRVLRQADQGFDLAVIPVLTFPTAPAGSYFGNDTVTFAPTLAASRAFGAFRVAGDLGFRVRNKANWGNLAVSSEMLLDVGAGYRFGEAEGPPIELDATIHVAAVAENAFKDPSQSSVEARIAANYKFDGPLLAFLGGGVGLTRGFATPDWRLLGGVRFAPDEGPRDRDGDGILDDDDLCPDEAEDKDGFSDVDGCPDNDDDKDGIVDAKDQCRLEPETVNGFQDEDGCPDEIPDSDKDGIKDDKDKCPTQPEDIDQFEDEDGCPDPDNDKDGVLDADDRCKNDPGPVENQGCPDPDRDGDGVVDRLDQCPDEPGKKELEGCKEKQLAVVRGSKIEILDRVYFKSGSHVLETRSYKLLNNVAQVILRHPEMARVRVEGHTDDVGDDASNLKLSQRRADSVRAYLIAQGVPQDRLVAQGFGETRPINLAKSVEARTENRRVEFNIEE